MLIQSLERRRYFTELSVTGTALPDAIALSYVSKVGSGVDIKVANNGDQAITVKVDSKAVQLAARATIRTEQILKGGVVKVRFVDLGNGGDTFEADAGLTVPITVSGGTGDDFITGGGGNDSIVGGDGNDRLTGNIGSDRLNGGTGDDVYAFTELPAAAETDTVEEPAKGGRDGLTFSDIYAPADASTPVRVDLSNGSTLAAQGRRRVQASGVSAQNLEDVTGSVGNDTIVGNAADNHIVGGDAIAFFLGDQLSGVRSGEPASARSADPSRDATDGDGGVVIFDSGPSPDTGNDVISGGVGNDLLAAVGTSKLNGGSGDDTLYTLEKAVSGSVDGGAGHDTQYADFSARYEFDVPGYVVTQFVLPANTEDLHLVDPAGVRRVLGNALNNHIYAGISRGFSVGDGYEGFERGAATINGGDGNDTIEGGTFDYTPGELQFIGGQAQTFEGGNGNDLLIGAAADEAYKDEVYLRGGPGNDTLQSASGTVWADYAERTAALRIDLGQGRFIGPAGEIDVFGVGVANVRGGTGNDTLIGDGRDNLIDGYFGRDDLSGGGGTDAVRYSGRERGIVASLDGKANDGETGENDLIRSDFEGLSGTRLADTLVGSGAADVLRGYEGNDSLDGGAGNDTLIGDGGSNVLFGNAGIDTAKYIYYDNGYGPENYLIASVTLDGKANDEHKGNSNELGQDNVMTENVDGADTVYGDAGPNRITGAEVAVGGAGNDTIEAGLADGGAGADTITAHLVWYLNETSGVAVSFDGVANDGKVGEKDNVLLVPVQGDSNEGSTVFGSRGNDTLVGTGRNEMLVGFGGNDKISGGGGDDALYGGAANYFFNAYSDAEKAFEAVYAREAARLRTADGNDTLAGGDGNDVADFTYRRDDQLIVIGDAAAGGTRDRVEADIESVVGGTGDDRFVGDEHDNLFFGGPGDDDFVGGGGRDRVSYADADFFGYYDEYDDFDEDTRLHGQGVEVILDGQANDGDRRGGEFDNVRNDVEGVIGTDATDFFYAGDRPATLDGGTGGEDYLAGSSFDDQLILGRGSSDEFGNNTGSVAQGFGGDDVFVNQNGVVDLIDGGDGFDSVQDDDASDFRAGLQNDEFTDTEFVYDAILTDDDPAAAAARSARAAEPAATAVVSGVAFDPAKGAITVTGRPDADVITLGVSKGNVVVTFNGTAKRYAGNTVKTLYVDAGGGRDTVTFLSAIDLPGSGRARVFGGSANDRLVGGPGNEILEGGAGDDVISGGDGNDVVSGGYAVLPTDRTFPAEAALTDGNDTIDGGGGSQDVVTYTRRAAPVVIDLTKGTALSANGTPGKADDEADTVRGAEYVIAGQGRDTLTGVSTGVNQQLFGGPSADTLTSGAGVDLFYGGRGADLIYPGSGDFVDTGGRDRSEDKIDGQLLKGGLVLTRSRQQFFGAFEDDDLFLANNKHWGDRF